MAERQTGEDGIGYTDHDDDSPLSRRLELEALTRLRGGRTTAEFAKVWPDSATALQHLAMELGIDI